MDRNCYHSKSALILSQFLTTDKKDKHRYKLLPFQICTYPQQVIYNDTDLT